MGEIIITPTIESTSKLKSSTVLGLQKSAVPTSEAPTGCLGSTPMLRFGEAPTAVPEARPTWGGRCTDADPGDDEDDPHREVPWLNRNAWRQRDRKVKAAMANGIHRLPVTKATATTAEKISGLTLREIESARRALQVVKALAYPSEATAKRIVLRHSHDYPDRPLLPVDISRAYHLYASEILAAGKSVDRPQGQPVQDYETWKALIASPQNLYADLLFVSGQTYLISVSAPLYRTMIDQIPSRDFVHVAAALKLHCDRYRAKGTKVLGVVFDGESALKDKDKVEANIGCPFTVLPPNTHVSIVERRIRTLKERARVAIYSLDYTLPRSLLPSLLSAIVHRLNGEPTSQRADSCTSNEAWLGMKTNLPSECAFAYGDYVTVTAPLEPGVKNTLVPRTERALILAPTQGGWWVLLLNTWKKVKRKGNGVVGQPTPVAIVELLNARAKKEVSDHAREVKQRSGTKRPKADFDQGAAVWQYGISNDDESARVDAAGGGLFLTPDDIELLRTTVAVTPIAPQPPRTDEHAHDDPGTTQSPNDGGVTTPMSPGQASSTESTEEDYMTTTNDDGSTRPLSSQEDNNSSAGYDSKPATTSREPPPTKAAGTSITDEIIVDPPATPRHAGPLDDTTTAVDEEHAPDTTENLPKTSRQTRRALQRKLGREASILAGRMMAEVESEARQYERSRQAEQQSTPSRASNRKRRRPDDGKWGQVNNLRPDQARTQFGKLETDNAIGDEIAQIVDKGVFEPVYERFLSKQQRLKIIKTKLFLKAKLNADGVFVKLKARLVARGDMEMKASFDSLYSPTGSMEAAFAILSIAAFERRKVKIIDLVGAYLTVDVRDNSETYVKFDVNLTEILIAKFPEYAKYVSDDGTFCGRLRKSLYGICQASSNLHARLKKTLVEEMHFVPNPKDPCVYNRTIDGKQVTVIVYVDDILATASSDRELESFTKEFQLYHPELTEKVGSVLDYLGMKLDLRVDGECSVSMQGYTERAAELWRAAHDEAVRARPDLFGKATAFRTYKAPCDEGLFEITESPELPKKQREEYHSLVATVLYMAKRSRPDLLCTTAMLATRVVAPTLEDWFKLRHLMSFARETASRSLKLRPSGIWVEAYTDASFGTHPDRKSQSGTVCTVGGAPYYCTSSRQKINAKSAAESEMISISDSGTMVQWGQQFLYHQGYVNLPPARIWEDNQATIQNLNRGAATATNSRHYEVKYFYISDLAKRGIVRVEHLETAEMTADLLTKGVTADVFTKLSNKLMTSQSDVARKGK